jgi:hypothetical protein
MDVSREAECSTWNIFRKKILMNSVQKWRIAYFVILLILIIIFVITLLKAPENKKLLSKLVVTIAVYIAAIFKLRKK